MRFTVLPVHGLEDVTLDLEQLQALLVGTFGLTATIKNAQVAWGAGTLTWPGASAFSNTLTVNHGLAVASSPVTPTCVQALAQLPGGAASVLMHYVSVSSTQIQFRGHTTDGSSPANTATTAFFWLAIG